MTKNSMILKYHWYSWALQLNLCVLLILPCNKWIYYGNKHNLENTGKGTNSKIVFFSKTVNLLSTAHSFETEFSKHKKPDN